MDRISMLQGGALVILLVLSAFFSSAETAFSTVNRVRIRTLREEGSRKAAAVQRILEQYSKMLSAILIGNNLVNIAASSLATTMAIRLWGSFAVGIVTGALTLAVLMFGEILPKTWAMGNAERAALSYAGIIYLLMTLLTPIIALIDLLAGGIMRLLRIDRDGGSAITERDLKAYVDVGHEDGAIELEERKMIYNVFEFNDLSAKDIMIPRIDVTMVSRDASYHQLLQVFKKSMYTRIPVYEDTTDNVVGIVNVKDFLLVPNKREFRVDDILRGVYYTYELKKTSDLMMEMRDASMNVSFVLNEYGACVGMITMEDLLEEIVGEIRDEYDEDEETWIQKVDDHTYRISGGMKLDDINDALGVSLHSEEYDSIGGLLIGELDHLPEKGESVTTPEGYRVQAEKVGHNRVDEALLLLNPPDEEEPPEDGAFLH